MSKPTKLLHVNYISIKLLKISSLCMHANIVPNRWRVTLLSKFHMRGTLQTLFYLAITMSLQCKYCFSVHFTPGEIEPQCRDLRSPRWQGLVRAVVGIEVLLYPPWRWWVFPPDYLGLEGLGGSFCCVLFCRSQSPRKLHWTDPKSPKRENNRQQGELCAGFKSWGLNTSNHRLTEACRRMGWGVRPQRHALALLDL